MDSLAALFSRAKRIYHTEGLMPLAKAGYRFLIYHLFEYSVYWLYTEPVPSRAGLNEADFMPRVDDYVWKVVSSNREADELEAEGYEFRSLVVNGRERLDSGVAALCVFVGKELANIAWVATSQEAKDCIREPPYRVDFANHETCWGGIWTHPRYRRLGLRRYARFKLDEFLLTKDSVRNRGAIRKGNVAAVNSRAQHFPPPYAEGRYLRILWWESWKETPLPREAGGQRGDDLL